jgi:hypothetical protein
MLDNIDASCSSRGNEIMRMVARKKRQDDDTLLPAAAALGTALAFAALWVAIAPYSVHAQAAVPCTALDDDAERLACYDRALRGTPPSAAPAAPPPAAPPADAEPAARAAAEAAAPSAASVETSARQPREVRGSTAAPAPAAPAASAAPIAGNTEELDGIIPIVIVGTRAHPGRETTFLLADGTSWVQTDSQRINGLPDTPFDAELKPGAIGSYFLVPKERGRAIRVRQVR